jgi:hypothetical protein
MPGIIRIKTWVPKDVLVYSDLNNEFDNIINNLQASNVDGYSSTVAQMRETTDPGAVGSESLALRISDEIERIRFAISRIVGKTYWYEAPARSLSTTYVNARNYFVPNGGTDLPDVVSEFISAGFIDSAAYIDPFFYSTAASDKKFTDTKYSLKNDPSFGRYFWVSPVSMVGNTHSFSLWFKNFAANDTIYYNPVYGMRLYLDSNGFLKLEQATSISSSNGSKDVVSIGGSTSLAGSSVFNNVIVRWKFQGGVGSSMELLLNGQLVVSSPFTVVPNYPSTNSMPILMGKRAFTSYVEALTNPGSDLPTVYTWSPNGTLTSASSNNGILTVDPLTATNTAYYSKAIFNSIPTNGLYFEFKYRLRDTTITTVNPQTGSHFGFYLRVDSGNYGMHCRINGATIEFAGSTAINTVNLGSLLSIDHNSMEWTNLAVIVKTSATYVFVNGKFEGSFVTPNADTTVGDLFAFGKVLTGTSYSKFDVEYFFCGNVPTSNPVYIEPNNTNTQYISDFCSFNDFLSDSATVQALQVTSPYLLFGRPESAKNYASNRSFISNLSVTTTTTQFLGEVCQFISDGKTPVKLNFKCVVRQGVSTGGTYNIGAYLNIRNEMLASVSGNQMINQANSGLNAGVSLMDSQVIVIPTGNQLMHPFTISYCEVLPAGVYSVFAYVANITSTAAITVHSVKCTASL